MVLRQRLQYVYSMELWMLSCRDRTGITEVYGELDNVDDIDWMKISNINVSLSSYMFSQCSSDIRKHIYVYDIYISCDPILF